MTDNRSKEMTRLAISALEDKKAEDISIIDISEVSVLADYFLIASGSNRSQIQALTDNVEEKLGRAGYAKKQIEGYDTANWILTDYGDIIVHIFDRKTVFSMIWKGFGDGKRVIGKNFKKKNAAYVQVSFKSINGVFFIRPTSIRFYIILSECFGVVPNFFL